MNKKRILYIDDDQDEHELVTSALRTVTSSVDMQCMMNARQGLEEARNSPPDLIMVDLNMPVMNGFTFLEHAGKDEIISRIPIIVYSTSGDPGHMQHALKLGAKQYLTKPYTYQEIVNLVKDVLAEYHLNGSGSTLHSSNGLQD